MARPKKTGLDYFPFDVDFFDDEKIVAIAGEFGLKGEITAIKLLCAVYRNGYFIEWSEMLKMKMLRSLPGISTELLDQIVNRLVKWDFFDKGLFDSVRVLTSKGIQRRFLSISRKRLKMDKYPYWLFPAPETTPSGEFLPPEMRQVKDMENPQLSFPAPEMRVSAPETPLDRGFLPPEIPQSKVKKIKKYSTDVESKESPSSPSPYSLTLDEEISTLKCQSIWLDNLQALHHMDADRLKEKLDEFRMHCVAEGKEHHDGLTDAKQHFNNWLRIVAAKQDKNAENRQEPRNRRRGNLLRADEEKDYSGSF